MAGRTYIGIDNVARKLRRTYLGVDNIARKIDRVYMGVDNIARCIFTTAGKLSYYGTSPSRFYWAQHGGVGLSFNNHAIFVGGYRPKDGYYVTTSLEYLYNRSLTRVDTTDMNLELPETVAYLSAVTVGEYAIFAGGTRDVNSTTQDSEPTNRVHVVDRSFTKLYSPPYLGARRYSMGATDVGGYAIFAGGVGYDSYNRQYQYYDYCDVFDSSLTKVSHNLSLSVKRYDLRAIKIGNYALFAGGQSSTNDSDVQSVVDAFDTSLTRTTVSPLSVPRTRLTSAVVGNYALFAGGAEYRNKTVSSAVVDAFDKSLTHVLPSTGLSIAREMLGGTSITDNAIFAGGVTTGGTTWIWSDAVDSYDPSLTRSVQTPLSEKRYMLMAASIGDYALFGGGRDSSIVDVYQVR